MEVQEQASHAAGEEDMDHVLTLQQTKPMSKIRAQHRLAESILQPCWQAAALNQHRGQTGQFGTSERSSEALGTHRCVVLSCMTSQSSSSSSSSRGRIKSGQMWSWTDLQCKVRKVNAMAEQLA
jgi:hypothetical protein